MGSVSNRPKKPYVGVWQSVDGLASGDVVTTHPDGHWPAMVQLSLEGPACEFGFSMTVLDAQNLATDLAAAAEWAQHENREAARERL